MTSTPVRWLPAPPGAAAPAPAPRFRRLTVMLTEICNLDCWMCDFAKSKRLTKILPLDAQGLLALLAHETWRDLATLTFTGGEPFAHPRLLDLYTAVRDAHPRLRVNFSSNGTLLPKMLPVFDAVRVWDRVGLLVSIDGMRRHDEQRGKEGSFGKTIGNLQTLRQRYPRLSITLKYTITPVNWDEIGTTCDFLNRHGFRFTVKMLEHNPHYTNKLTGAAQEGPDGFTADQIAAIRHQLEAVLAAAPRGLRHARRVGEIREVLASLDPHWRRTARCCTPREVAFLDSDLNLFTCKEYGPVLNLGRESLDLLTRQPQYAAVIAHERDNSGRCTRCTSQMKRTPEAARWLGWLASWAR